MSHFSPDRERQIRFDRPVYSADRRSLVRWAALLVLVSVAAAAVTVGVRWSEAISEAHAELRQYMGMTETNLAEVPTLTAREQTLLRRSLNARHVATARRMGIPPPADREALAAEEERGTLKYVATTPAYYVRGMRYGVPYATPDAVALLDLMGNRFHERLTDLDLPPYRFTVSSILRTGEDQAALRRVNRNAAAGTSSHSFGTTFDVPYLRYSHATGTADSARNLTADLPRPVARFIRPRFENALQEHYKGLAIRHERQLKALMGRVLIELEDEGTLIVVMERGQPVYHITVAENLAG